MSNFLTGKFKTKNITIYGRGVNNWAVYIRNARYGYICFRLPFLCFGYWTPLYFYLSPDGTPSKSTFYIGKRKSFEDWATARLRYKYFGHNYDIKKYELETECINYFDLNEKKEIIDILKRAKSEIKALSIIKGIAIKNKLLMSDLERYIDLYSGKKE